uniref:glycoside hydrolase family 127 protein n=1 Tax=Agreia sp. TaxID=1872416 RepID=UPI0035BC6331
MPKSRLIAPVAPINSRHLAFTPIGLEAARLTAGPWSNWQQANREVTTPHTFAWLEKDGTIDNLRRLDPAAQRGPRRGLWFTDSDLYKALEAVAWDASHDETDETPDEVALLDEIGAIIAAAQESDGYINSFVQAGLDVRWDNLVQSHELYCIGHLIQAGIADKRVRGRTTLFDAAKRAADVAVADFADRRRGDTDGHPEIEMALVELYRETGEKQYLELAQQFIDVRGHFVLDPNGHFDNAYYQDATPVRDETTVVGHAVRAIYLLAGVVDLYIETGEQALLDAALVQWNSMNSAKTYLTGAVGSRFAGEAFGDDYELPPDLAYGETCATIGNIMLSWRLLLATGESRFADTIERALYNLFSASTNTSRTGFFYNNPAQRRAEYPAAPLDERPTRADAPGTRPTWFECACCPPNIMRTIATLSAYIATENATGVQVHQFIPSQLSFVVDG